MYKVCIFDLDGTIADTVESIAHVGKSDIAGIWASGNTGEGL